jgi:hypothetical protein
LTSGLPALLVLHKGSGHGTRRVFSFIQRFLMPQAKKQVPRPSPKPALRVSSPPKKSAKTTEGYHGKSPLAMIMYGVPGVGKTEWAGHFPDVGFIYDPQEPGCQDLYEFGSIPKPTFMEEADSWSATIKLLEKVATGKLKCSTLVLDSLLGFEKLCFQYHCAKYFDNDWSKEGFYAFQSGPKNAAKTDWPELIDYCDAVRAVGTNVILLAHSEAKLFNNPEGPDYDRYIPVMDKATWAVCHRWAKAILFYNYQVSVEKKGIKAKARQDEQRNIYCTWTPAYDAKNRYNLGSVIEAGGSGKEAYQNFERAFIKGASKGPRK